MAAATIASAQESAAKLPTPKLPSNPFVGKQYLGLVLPLALIALWYILSTNGVFTQVQLPSPDRVVGAGIELAQRGELSFQFFQQQGGFHDKTSMKMIIVMLK